MKAQRIGDVTNEVLAEYAKRLRKIGRSENTIKSHLGHLRAALNWAVDRRYIPACPKIPMPKRAKVITVMRGRALTDEEFVIMLSVVPQGLREMDSGIPPSPEDVAAWRFYLRGLWTSGLRLEESLTLHWTDRRYLCLVDIDDADPTLWVPADEEKGNRDRYVPIAPEFVDLLRNLPCREGFVFNPTSQRPSRYPRLGGQQVGRTVSKIGELSGIEVSPSKMASAHDLRRSFGDRWAQRVTPAILMELMRHQSITTTMKYYVGREAKRTSQLLRNTMQSLGTNLGTTQRGPTLDRSQTP